MVGLFPWKLLWGQVPGLGVWQHQLRPLRSMAGAAPALGWVLSGLTSGQDTALPQGGCFLSSCGLGALCSSAGQMRAAGRPSLLLLRVVIGEVPGTGVGALLVAHLSAWLRVAPAGPAGPRLLPRAAVATGTRRAGAGAWADGVSPLSQVLSNARLFLENLIK